MRGRKPKYPGLPGKQKIRKAQGEQFRRRRINWFGKGQDMVDLNPIPYLPPPPAQAQVEARRAAFQNQILPAIGTLTVACKIGFLPLHLKKTLSTDPVCQFWRLHHTPDIVYVWSSQVLY
jgi:hypothetical protein